MSGREKADGKNRGLVTPFSSSRNPLEHKHVEKHVFSSGPKLDMVIQRAGQLGAISGKYGSRS